MGRKVKVGKQRKDRFYKLAKETGYRSRAAFKLLQLNRKFEFLQRSRVLIDLCAAPGGWLQVAQNSMPVSSLIVGVDLVPIKPIPNIISIQEDITTDTCRQALKKQLKTWKADIVLHDGAPNVGKNWIHDAYTQSQLTLNALKLATEFLVPNGWFVTKVFRSRDYNSLIWVMEKLFKKVHATKPQASRTESAEIFVVCQGYKAPDKIDSRFLDASHLFKDVEGKSLSSKILQPTAKKPKAEGYEDGEKSVFFKLPASEFIFGDNHLEMLSKCTQIVFDDEDIENHKTTTKDIKDYCNDIKVLSKKAIRSLLTWRKNMQALIKKQDVKDSETNLQNSEDEDDKDVQEAIDEGNYLEEMKYRELKRKKKKILVEKKKLHEKLNLKMIIKDDEPIIQEERELFSIKNLKSKKDLANLQDEDVDANRDEIKEVEPEPSQFRSTYTVYDRHNEEYDAWDATNTMDTDEKFSDSESEEEMEFVTTERNEEDDEELPFNENGTEDSNPLLVELLDNSQRVKATVDRWFDKDYLDVDDDDLDLELLAQSSKRKNIPSENKNPKPNKKLTTPVNQPALEETESANESEDEAPVPPEQQKKKKKKRVILDPEGLALGALMIHSKKARRDILDSAYNRYASNDENLPDWFVKDEAKHNRKEIPVSAEMVADYKARLKEINARPIKKVIEAKARKKQKAMRKLEKARKRAEAITENMDMSNKEKSEQVKMIYKKAMKKKEDGVTYVVAKKGIGKRARRPPGVKGRFKMVDKRMRKDDRIRKSELKSKKKFKPKMSSKRKR